LSSRGVHSSVDFGIETVMKKMGYGVMIIAALVGLYGVWVTNLALVMIGVVAEIFGVALVTESKRKTGE